MAPKLKSSDGANLDVPKRSCNGPPLSKKGEYSKYFEKERNHIHLTSINLLLCITDQVYHRYVCIVENIVHLGFGTICSFKHSLGALERSPLG